MRRTSRWVIGLVGIVLTAVLFLVPFAFILTQAAKDANAASLLEGTLPTHWQLWENVVEVFRARNYMLIIAFINSTILTVANMTLLVVFGAMIAYVLERRKSAINVLINTFVLAGLIIPPAVVPTIWVMQSLPLFKTLPGLILVEVAFGLSFTVPTMRLHLLHSPRDRRSRHRGRRRTTAAVLPGGLPAASLGGRDDHRRPVDRRVQRLPEPALLPAG